MKSGQILKSWRCDVVRAAVPVTYPDSVSPDGFIVQEDKNRCGECRCRLLHSVCMSNFNYSHTVSATKTLEFPLFNGEHGALF